MAAEKKDKPLHADHRARMQQRVQREGLDSLAPHEVLEYLLYFAIPRRDTNALAHRLINHFGSYCNVLDASEEELCKVEGIGPASARLIASLHGFEQVYQLQLRRSETRPLRTAEDRIAYARPLFYGARNECCYLIALNDKLMPLRDILLSKGAPNHVVLNPRQLAREAVASGCTCGYLAHNHPSGLAVPSPKDIEATSVANRMLYSLGIRLLDHIIITSTDAVSLMPQYCPRNEDREPR